MVELRLQQLAHLFSTLDPSLPEEKDLEAGAEEFIVSWARQLPGGRPLTLRIHLTGKAPDAAESGVALQAYRTYFGKQAGYARFKLARLFKEGGISLVIGLLFLGLCMTTGDWLTTVADHGLTRVLGEGLLVGGWVAMWRPMQTFLYDWWPLRREMRLLQRLAAARVELLGPGGAGRGSE
ncbi:MAG TPA: hypothetical protein VIX81_06730 [Gammaproteobacteria bacterium]